MSATNEPAISSEEVEHIALLSRLDLTEREIDGFLFRPQPDSRLFSAAERVGHGRRPPYLAPRAAQECVPRRQAPPLSFGTRRRRERARRRIRLFSGPPSDPRELGEAARPSPIRMAQWLCGIGSLSIPISAKDASLS